jgi:hypothetical protein
MVNTLLTMSIKVNIPSAASCSQNNRGFVMKKQNAATRGFWSWVIGGGWTNTGSRG